MKGNKPDFHEAMAPDESKPLYDKFLKAMQQNYPAGVIKGAEYLI